MRGRRDGKPKGFPERLRRTIARFRSDDGSAAAEFAMLSPFIIAIMLSSIEVGYIFLAKTELSRVAQAAARAIEYNEAQNMTQAQFQSAACANIAVIVKCSNLLLNVQSQTSCSTISTALPSLTYDANGNVTNKPVYNQGTNGSIVVLQALYPLPVIGAQLLQFANQSNGTLLISSTFVFMNEP